MGRPKKLDAAATFEIVREAADGASLRDLAAKHEVGRTTIARILAATEDGSSVDLTDFKRDLARGKLRLAGLTDQMLTERILNGERVSLGELAVIGGIATQRALEIERQAGTSEPPPDWSVLSGWCGDAKEGEDKKDGAEPDVVKC